MSKSAIYLTNSIAGTTIADGGNYPLTQIQRRFGCDCSSDGTGLICRNSGYYKIDAVITATAAAAGPVTATLLNSGVAIPGATATVTAVADALVTIPLTAIIKVACCSLPAEITIEISGGATTTSNAELTAFKL